VDQQPTFFLYFDFIIKDYYITTLKGSFTVYCRVRTRLRRLFITFYMLPHPRQFFHDSLISSDP
jgi:hypothetical protein